MQTLMQNRTEKIHFYNLNVSGLTSVMLTPASEILSITHNTMLANLSSYKVPGPGFKSPGAIPDMHAQI